MTPARTTPTRTLLRLGGFGVGAACLAATFLEVDPTQVARVASQAGFLLTLVVLPYLASSCLDCLGLSLLIARTRPRCSYLRLVEVRLAADALLLSAPLGSPLADGLTVHLLRTRCGVPVPEAVASVATRKVLMVVAQSLCAAAAALAAATSLRGASFPASALPAGLLALSIGLMAAALAAAAVLAGGATARRLRALLGRLPGARLRRWLEERTDRFDHTDVHLAQAFRDGAGKVHRPVLSFAGAWLAESFETLLVLGLIGVHLGYARVLPMEVAVTFLRSAAVFVPAGLGVQEASHVALLAALGAPDPVHTGAVLAAVKRLREACFVAIGYALLARRPAVVLAASMP